MASSAQPSAPLTADHQQAIPRDIIGPQYCSPNHRIDLAIVRKVSMMTGGNFAVTDVNGNIMFKVKGVLSFRGRRVLLDATGNPIVTLRQKLMTMHARWQVFRGESTKSRDLLFSAKRTSIFQWKWKTKLDVFLANNTEEEVCDFRIEGRWFENSCVIRAGESSTNILAQMQKKHTVQSVLFGKDNFMVTVYPNIDYAFIVALIVVLDEILQSNM
ncbi:hypothetical protein TIFTF001_009717 [Ficus carica]|uniref:Uncharacterized protein n=1 Tax=Ficus carica TaxID=3494 RepID=A0AA88A7D3_FICCA|nr:hypothetical protein TIFTF001_009717 [Ficus carica]